ncbi:hypothetical protein P9139_09370 [Curtobacterium flaccumfaciens]|nr:hypothetical protein P9139_09370 [Curtobacterium flaccumfaciens]
MDAGRRPRDALGRDGQRAALDLDRRLYGREHRRRHEPGRGTTNPGGGSTGTASGLVFSPYKDVTVNLDWNTNVMNTAVTGTRIPVVGASNSLVSTREPGLKAITLAFATGTCGSENWGGVAADAFASANIPKLDAAGVNYIVSTGGAAGSFTCSGTALQKLHRPVRHPAHDRRRLRHRERAVRR